MNYMIKQTGESRSFPAQDPFLANASTQGDVLVVLGPDAGRLIREMDNLESWKAVLVELATECLGVYTGESRGEEGSNVLGFARFRLGDDPPSKLVELVRQPASDDSAIAAAQALFQAAELDVALCYDSAGRIIDRLVRPYYNETLRRLDEKLATADDLDLTLRLGLGYPEGPINLLERSGLAHHHDVTQALFDAYGQSAYAPARRARVAKQRSGG